MPLPEAVSDTVGDAQEVVAVVGETVAVGAASSMVSTKVCVIVQPLCVTDTV